MENSKNSKVIGFIIDRGFVIPRLPLHINSRLIIKSINIFKKEKFRFAQHSSTDANCWLVDAHIAFVTHISICNNSRRADRTKCDATSNYTRKKAEINRTWLRRIQVEKCDVCKNPSYLTFASRVRTHTHTYRRANLQERRNLNRFSAFEYHLLAQVRDGRRYHFA